MAVIVFVDLGELTVKQMPNDVHVTARRDVVRWLRSRPAALDPSAVIEIYSQARLDVTWR